MAHGSLDYLKEQLDELVQAETALHPRSRAEIKVFPHKDAAAADRLLEESKAPGRRQLLITDGVFSMDGDIAPLPDLVEVAEKHRAIMMIDDAHASGVLGTGGKGTVSHFGLDPARA